MNHQRGGTFLGLVIGLVLGLLIALGVILYVNKVPVPFLNKVPTHSAEQDAAEAQKNRNWDPNAPLYGKNPAVPRPVASAPAASDADAASAPVRGEAASAAAAARDPAAILGDKPASAAAASAASAPEPFLYYVQAGAFTQPEEAEQQRARVALLGLEARVSEREQAGRTVYRVRVGPFDQRSLADETKATLSESGIDSAVVRIQR